MYKLLTTAAVIMAVATPSIANEWTGGKQLTKDLETIYGALDGESQFGTLQGAYEDNSTATGKNGQLSNFFGTVSKGITHITLTVDANNNITPGIVPGTTFIEIDKVKTDLVNRVNYDLFVDTDEANYVALTDYTGYKAVDGGKLIIDGSPENAEKPANDYTGNHDTGLAGIKISGLVSTVNTVNDFLIDTDTTKTQSETFVTEFGLGLGSANTDVVSIFSDINDLNTAINTASTDGGAFFGDIDGATFTEGNVNDFLIPSFNEFDRIGDPVNTIGYTSISNWANDIQTVVTSGGTGTITGAGTVVVTDDANGKITLDGIGYTFDTDSSTFLAD